jgi:hypothetical protein
VVRLVVQRPGHAHVSTTLQIYTHVDEEARSQALSGLNDLLSSDDFPAIVVRNCGQRPLSRSRMGETPGGAKGTRTPDPLLAKQVLFQLSYSPRKPQVTRLVADPSIEP